MDHFSSGGDSGAGVRGRGRRRPAEQTVQPTSKSVSMVHANLLDDRHTSHGISHAYSPVLLLCTRFNTTRKTSLATDNNSPLSLIWALFTIALCNKNSLYRNPRMMVSDTYFSKGFFRGNSDGSLMKLGSEFQASCDRRKMFLSSVSTKVCHHSS